MQPERVTPMKPSTIRRKWSHAASLAFSVLLVALASDARAITIDWTTVGNPGNAADVTGYGAVGYSYNIGTYDVTASQYVAFLNSNDPTGADPLGLYNSSMSNATYGSVVYTSGAASGDKYSVVSGDGNLPINYVTFYDTLRFANWLNNGQTPGSTETGAYTLLGGTPTPSNGNSITRNADATVFLPERKRMVQGGVLQPGHKLVLHVCHVQQHRSNRKRPHVDAQLGELLPWRPEQSDQRRRVQRNDKPLRRVRYERRCLSMERGID